MKLTAYVFCLMGAITAAAEANMIRALPNLGGVHPNSSVNCLGTAMVGSGAMDVLIAGENFDIYFSRGCFRKLQDGEDPPPLAVAFMVDPPIKIAAYGGVAAIHHAYTKLNDREILEKDDTGWSHPIQIRPCDGRCSPSKNFSADQMNQLVWGVFDPQPQCPFVRFAQWEKGITRKDPFYGPLQFTRALAQGRVVTHWLNISYDQFKGLAGQLELFQREVDLDKYPLDGNNVHPFLESILNEYLSHPLLSKFQIKYVSDEVLPPLIQLREEFSKQIIIADAIDKNIQSLKSNPAQFFHSLGAVNIQEVWDAVQFQNLSAQLPPAVQLERGLSGECLVTTKVAGKQYQIQFLNCEG